MNTNAWVAITEVLAQSWHAWATWHEGGQQGAEPIIDDFARSRVFPCMVDWSFSFQAFKPADIAGIDYRMGNLWRIDLATLSAGYMQYPDAWRVIGFWEWMATDTQCRQRFDFPWDPALALQFMPDIGPSGAKQPATELRDVSLLHGQPPRAFAADAT